MEPIKDCLIKLRRNAVSVGNGAPTQSSGAMLCGAILDQLELQLGVREEKAETAAQIAPAVNGHA
jgi:hypothetical protein